MNKNVEVQKSNENLKKDVQKDIKIEQNQNFCKGCNNSKKVNLTGKGISSLTTQKRYSGIHKLFSRFENNLTEKLPFDVSINYIVLESLVCAFKEFENDEETIKFFTDNIKAKNFFYLVNDISRGMRYNSSDKIHDKFLYSAQTLRKLDEFYDEFEDIHDNSMHYGYNSLYLFDELFNSKKSNESYLNKIIKTAYQMANLNDRHFACNILNEFYNRINCSNLTEDSIDEYFHKIIVINDKWETIFNKKSEGLYTLDSLYSLVTE